MAVGSENIEYGYNAQGQYVAKAVGSKKINYGYNAKGQYVPVSIGKASSEAILKTKSSAKTKNLFPDYNPKTKKWNHQRFNKGYFSL